MVQIVNINIIKQTKALPFPGFGTLLFVTDETPAGTFGSDRTKLYTEASAITDVSNDFGVSSDTTKAITALFSQQVKPEKVRVAIRDAAVPGQKTIVFDADFVAGNVIAGTVNGQTFSVPFNTDHATTITDLATAIQASEAVDTAAGVDDTPGATITVDAESEYELEISGVNITGGASQANISINTIVAGRTIFSDLVEAIDEVDDWYAVAENTHNKGAILSAAAFVEANKKLGGFASNEAAMKTAATNDIASLLKANNYDRSFVFFHHDLLDFVEVALFGRTLPLDPGAVTFALKELSGVAITTKTDLTDSELNNVISKNANVYVDIGGTGATWEGRLSSSNFIDITRDVDFIEASIILELNRLLKFANKIAFTNSGIKLVKSKVQAVLERNLANENTNEGIVRPETISVTAPLVSEVPENDRANRLLPDIDFSFQLAGAIHEVQVNGVVSI